MESIGGVGQQPVSGNVQAGLDSGQVAASGAGSVTASGTSSVNTSGAKLELTSITQQVTSLMQSVGLNPGDHEMLGMMIGLLLLQALLNEDGDESSRSQMGDLLGLGVDSKQASYTTLTQTVFAQTRMAPQAPYPADLSGSVSAAEAGASAAGEASPGIAIQA